MRITQIITNSIAKTWHSFRGKRAIPDLDEENPTTAFADHSDETKNTCAGGGITTNATNPDSHGRMLKTATQISKREFTFECPHCRCHLRTPDGWAGRQIVCPTCSVLIRVPPAHGKTSAYNPETGRAWDPHTPMPKC